jgi:hypothetical protein
VALSKIPNRSIDIPAGTSEPTNPSVGQLWYDTNNNKMKSYNGADWLSLTNPFSVSGGTKTSYSSGGTTYSVHTFTGSGVFSFDGAASLTADILIVGGGGGTGHALYHAGGGGAGGAVYGSQISLSPGRHIVTVGAGGAGGTVQYGDQGVPGQDNGQSGNDSSFGTLATAKGGGAGGWYQVTPGSDGGCGGGGAANGFEPSHVAGTSIQGDYSGFTSYGNDGGAGGSNSGAGGGGGIGEAGEAADTRGSYAGNGGDGLAFSITGSSVYYGGGGGGSKYNTNEPGLGGLGGGGDGSAGPNAENGTPNTGGGAGAPERSGSDANSYGKQGGSGIVIIRYEEPES